MGRQKKTFIVSKHDIHLLKEYTNIIETQYKMTEMFKEPEFAELIETEQDIASSILKSICKSLKITGKPDMKYIKDKYEYYKSTNKIKPEYKNFLE